MLTDDPDSASGKRVVIDTLEWPPSALSVIERLRAALKECADDLEASVNAEYRGTLDYPSQRRKYDRDMGPVIRARHLLG